MLDDFTALANWQAHPSGEAELRLSVEDGALRLDFDFHGGGGFVAARREFKLAVPDDYAFAFRVRGVAPRNKLEFKLADPTGRNVWRWQEEDFDFNEQARELVLRGSRMEFAWGPAGGGSPKQLGAIEFVLSAGPGGKGTVWIEPLRFQDRTPEREPLVTASSSARGTDPQSILTSEGCWRAMAGDDKPGIDVDFHELREFGGLVVDWEARPASLALQVMVSDDARQWRTLYRAEDARGERSFIPLPGAEARHLRLAFGTQDIGIKCLSVKPYDFARSTIDFLHHVAALCPRGRFPRYLSREQSYWTCAGVPEAMRCALINEEGMVEPDKGSFSLEPFLYSGGRLFTWADAEREVGLEDGALPIPSAHWALPGWTLQTTVFASGEGDEAVVFIRYRVTNAGGDAACATLFVAVRPFQVTPPWQAWQGLGGISEVREISYAENIVQVNRNKQVIALRNPDGFGAAGFEQGIITEYLAAGELPPHQAVKDTSGLASAALRFDLALAAGVTEDVFLAVPMGSKTGKATAFPEGKTAFDEAVSVMRSRLGAVSFDLPPGTAADAGNTFTTAAGQILINRDGAALQPGPRRYTRSWIRDGAIMGAALLRIGEESALPEFIRWYAGYQREDGFVPCCVDGSGADWLVEHDSHGQLIYSVAESYRFTNDIDFLRDLWPQVKRAADFIVKLRAERMTDACLTPDKRDRYGLLPESASHEGYLAHPVHSYWDDFWGVRGLCDAAAIARALGKHGDAGGYSECAADFRKSLRESLAAVIATKQLRYIPGSVEWADFDPTATSNAISLLHFADDLPAEQLAATYDLFLSGFRQRLSGAMDWNNYSAYEIRIVGALVQLGRRAEAVELFESYIADRRPLRWNQWPEISWRDPLSPGHLGDVPHTWIAAEYMLAFAILFAWEREADDALVLASGLPEEWLAAPNGAAVKGLRTYYGALDFSAKLGEGMSLRIGGALRLPAGGFVLRPPCPAPIHSVTCNGRPVESFTANEVSLDEFPAEVTITFSKP